MIVFSNIWQVAGSLAHKLRPGPSLASEKVSGKVVAFNERRSAPSQQDTAQPGDVRWGHQRSLLLPACSSCMLLSPCCRSSSLWDELEGEKVIITHMGCFIPP